ncbi:putative membrane protein [Chlamydia ibidis]|uniref:Membrane protein n=2 Tax=Chlamydia ibidis TaxID=1405396 RepID=A0ABP2XE36_9CHLA|nr:putative membrane protein [Chlamydia ibidis]EQM62658.1 putative membrane protein [Chlamydia ibidis 10-1398/6]
MSMLLVSKLLHIPPISAIAMPTIFLSILSWKFLPIFQN